MEASAPNGVLQYVDQHTKDLHAGVATNAHQAGHPVTKAQVNPEDNSPLDKIKELFDNVTNDAVVTGSALWHGEDAKTYEKTSPGRKAILFVKERMKKLWK